jgi:hypothetical protein
MQRSSYTAAAFILVALVATPCRVNPADQPPKPYPAIAIALPAAPRDPSFEAFRGALAAAAKDRRYSELAPLVAREFFWARDFAHAFDGRRPAVDNLAAAIRLEHREGSGWQALAAFAAEPTAEPLVSRPGVVCAPAPPQYDRVAFARMLDETHGAQFDWNYPRTEHTPVHVAPERSAAVIGTINLHFVRRLGFDRANGASSNRNHWTRIVTPAGLVGFVIPGALMSLNSERLCYGKDAVGQWRIVGYVAATD